MTPKECPLCTSNMRRVTRTITSITPGSQRAKARTYDEWECPDCDYFEEIEEEKGGTEAPASGHQG
jgi:hypothetical protein